MGKTYALYNLKSGYNTTLDSIQALKEKTGMDIDFYDVCAIKDYGEFFSKLGAEDDILICGGDGTLNRFVNNTKDVEYSNKVFYYPTGTGNDFAQDLGYGKNCEPFEITKYLKDLPTVTIDGKTRLFVNGVGFGIDGYCCEVGDIKKKTATKPVNYTAIAIKGLLYGYKPSGAVITVDGVSHRFEKVWIAPTMNGRYYGGGMQAAPEQKRDDENKTLSLVLFHDSNKLKTLMVFPSIFKGKHIEHTEMVSTFTGHEITVEFDKPSPLQIDGETVLNVKSYIAKKN